MRVVRTNLDGQLGFAVGANADSPANIVIVPASALDIHWCVVLNFARGVAARGEVGPGQGGAVVAEFGTVWNDPVFIGEQVEGRYRDVGVGDRIAVSVEPIRAELQVHHERAGGSRGRGARLCRAGGSSTSSPIAAISTVAPSVFPASRSISPTNALAAPCVTSETAPFPAVTWTTPLET